MSALDAPAELADLLLKTLLTEDHALLYNLYQRRGELPASDFFAAAAVGDVTKVESMLSVDPSWATRKGGPLQTGAITYVAHGRFSRIDPTYPARQHRIVELLLARGADPNSYAYEDTEGEHQRGRLSALYGCCRAPGNPFVARQLLDAGAKTDDGESLYHATELEDLSCLELLFAAGVASKERDWSIRRALDWERPQVVRLYLEHGANPNVLDWALYRNRSLEVVRLLVEHGADLNAPGADYWVLERVKGLTPVQIAERSGTTSIVEYLLQKGARDNRTSRDRLIGACVRADSTAVRDILHSDPGLIGTFTAQDHSNVAASARQGRIDTVRLMLDIGFDIEARADDLDATPIVYAASTANVAMLQLLISRGSRLDAKNRYGGTPLGTAVYCAAHFPGGGGDYPQAVRLLLDAGEQPTADQLQFAADSRLTAIAELLQAAMRKNRSA